jgi:tRNA pseudouridine synthase 10
LGGHGVLKVLEKAQALLEKHPLCDHCLGRQFSMLGHGLTNGERGKAIKLLLVLEGSRLLLGQPEQGRNLLKTVAINGFSEVSSTTLNNLGDTVENMGKRCYLCDETFKELDALAEHVVTMLSGHEFDTFLIGVRVSAGVEDREDELRAKFKIKWGESIRSDLSREIGKRVMKSTEKDVAFKRPDILVTINPFTRKIALRAHSLHVFGYYRKLARGIPQAKWVCSRCGGHGCEACKGTGKLYPESVEELIAQPLLKATGGSDVKIHAAGREDIDARMLGSGRPFIIEVLNPVKRRINLERLGKEINRTAQGKVEVEHLKLTSKATVRKLKAAEGAEKVYRVIVEFTDKITDDLLSSLEETMENTLIIQQTPTRVMHRRAMKTRRRRLFRLQAKRLKPDRAEMVLRCEGGLYIKEFISGDGGRTTPSITEFTQIQATCVELDVMKVCVKGFTDAEVKGVSQRSQVDSA